MSALLEAKKREIYSILTRYNGNKTQAANHLGMSIRSLRDLTNHDPMFFKFKNDPPSFSQINTERKTEMNQGVQVPEKKAETSEVFDTRNVVKKLESLMDRVTEKECTTQTVHAACDCAGKITDILRLHLEVERLRVKRG